MNVRSTTKLFKPTVSDVDTIQELINSFAQEEVMLARSKNELYENIRDFWCIKDGSTLIGCCAIHVTWADLGEIKSLAVKKEWWGRGLGSSLVHACIEDARSLGLMKLFALTYVPHFFCKLGFKAISKDLLPHKIWNECIRCVKFPNCAESAVMLDLHEQDGASKAQQEA